MSVRIDMDKLREYVEERDHRTWPATGYERYEMFKTHINNLSNLELLELVEYSGCLVDDAQAPTG